VTSADSDPISQIYDALWSLLERSAEFCALVPVRNRIKFSGDARDPRKETIQDADLPEVQIVAGGGTPLEDIASDLCGCTRQFQVQVSTGDQRMNARFYPVVTAIERALLNWVAVLGALTWGGQKYVQFSQWLNVAEGLSDPERNRGIKGWSSVWGCEVRLVFSTALVIPTLTP
jgi:hypothetical protein